MVTVFRDKICRKNFTSDKTSQELANQLIEFQNIFEIIFCENSKIKTAEILNHLTEINKIYRQTILYLAYLSNSKPSAVLKEIKKAASKPTPSLWAAVIKSTIGSLDEDIESLLIEVCRN